MQSRALALWLLGLTTLGGLMLLVVVNEPLRGREMQVTGPNTQGLAGQMPPGFDADVARVVANIDQIEADTLRDVNRTTRFSQREPQSYMYATFAPVLHYNALEGDFVGGNFWDMRASGYRLQNPSAEQAQGPPTNPVEMGLPDSACPAYRLSKAPYRRLFGAVWGADLFAIEWPDNVERVCATPGPPAESDPYPVYLRRADRQRSDHVYDGFGLTAVAYEASPEVSPFTSKYDYVQAGAEHFTPQEAMGYALFRGKAGRNQCHRDGGPGEEPLFTDFTASNLGVPRNPALQFYYEATPDGRGYSPNHAVKMFTHLGAGFFLRKLKSALSAAVLAHKLSPPLAPRAHGPRPLCLKCT